MHEVLSSTPVPSKKKKKDWWARHLLFISVVLAAQEAETRRTVVQDQLGQIIHETPRPKNN
jgi:hypothetical protein